MSAESEATSFKPPQLPEVVYVIRSSQPASISVSHATENGKRKQDRPKFLEWATFVVVVIYTLISGFQWNQIKETNRLTRAALESGESSLGRTLAKMQGEIDAINALVIKAGLQVDQLSATAQQTTRLAEATEATNRNIVNADRPWFGADIKWSRVEVGSVPRVSISFKNSGKRPAYITEYKVEGHRFLVFPSDPPYSPGRGGKDFVVPGEGIGGDPIAIFGELPLSSAEIRSFDASAWKEYIYADLEYRDSLTNEKHHTHACIRYLAPSASTERGFFNCETYNEGD